MTGNELIGFIIANHLEDYEFIRYDHGDRHDIDPEIDEDNHQDISFIFEIISIHYDNFFHYKNSTLIK